VLCVGREGTEAPQLWFALLVLLLLLILIILFYSTYFPAPLHQIWPNVPVTVSVTSETTSVINASVTLKGTGELTKAFVS
jgi:hypothetical protein